MTTLIPKFDFKNGGSTPIGAINRSIYEKLSDTISVKDFGAIGNGSTDDTSAIQAAINANYGSTIYFPAGNYLISSALNITAPISLDCAPGSFQGTSTYGARIFTNTVGINLLNISYSGAAGNQTGGGSIKGLLLDGNTKAVIGLNITGVNTTKVNFYDLNIYGCTNFGLYITGNHSYSFFGCQFNFNGSNVATDAGVKINGANCVNFYGCDSEANNGSGVIFSQGYNNQWNGGTVEGNNFHGFYLTNLAQQSQINNVDFEANNNLAGSNIYDINISGANNSYWTISNNQFSTNANTPIKIYNAGQVNYFYNNRNYNGSLVKWIYTAGGGVFEGNATNGISFDGTGNAIPYVKMVNSYTLGFTYSTPAFPSTGATFSNPFDANYIIYITDPTGITAYTLYDGTGTAQVFTGTPAVNTSINVFFGWNMKVSYTGTPTWKWAQV